MKLLIRVITVDDIGTRFTSYSYDEKHRLKTIKESFGTWTYSYDGSDLSTIETTFTGSGKVVMTNLNGKPTQATQRFSTKSRTYGYLYVADQLSEIHTNEGGVVVDIKKYTFLNHNISQILTEGGGGTLTAQYTYGINKSPFLNSGLSYVLGGVENMERYSVNELLEVKNILPNGSVILMKNVYTYDADGFPMTLVTTRTESSRVIGGEKFTFEYETF